MSSPALKIWPLDTKMYAILEDGKSIQCFWCGLISYNTNDVKNRFCGNCHRWHEQPDL